MTSSVSLASAIRLMLVLMGWLSDKMDGAKAAASAKLKDQVQSVKDSAKEKVTGQSATAKATPSVLTIPRTAGEDFFPRQVAGESNYTQAIRNVIGKQGGEKNMWVTLEREPSNKYDRNAIRVHIQGATVGYVPREETQELQGLLQAAERQNVVVMAWARVWYSGDAGGDPYGSVQYDMGEAFQAWPVNARPSEADSAVWPNGRRLKVSVSDDQKAVVQNALSRAFVAGKCVGYVKLDLADGARKVTVSFEGTPFGSLSPAASTNMGEILKVAQGAGRAIYVLAEFIGNAVVAEVRIVAKPPEELSNEEINQMAAPVTTTDWAPPTASA